MPERLHFPRAAAQPGFLRPVEHQALRDPEPDPELDEKAAWVRARLVEEAARPGDPTTVYIMFQRVPISDDAATDVPLYVGITRSITSRTQSHGTQKPWFPDVDYILTEPWRNRRIATRREGYLIRALQPLHNKAAGRLVLDDNDGLGRMIDDLARDGVGAGFPVDRKMPGLGAGLYALLPDRPTHEVTMQDHAQVLRMPDHVRAAAGFAA